MTEISVDDFSIDELMQLNKRQISPEDLQKYQGYMAEIFTALGMDINTPSTHETPRRFLEALLESTNGYEGDPKLIKAFPKECRGEPDCRLSQVIEGPIHFHALCEHHVFPFYGEAYVDMLPMNGFWEFQNLPDLSVCTQKDSRFRNVSDTKSQIRLKP